MTDPKHILLLELWLQSSDGRFTPDVAAAATGLSVQHVQDALLALVERYECHMQLDEVSGKVVVQFTVPLVRLHPEERPTFANKVRALGRNALRLGRVLYKASLGLVMLAYTVVYAVTLLDDDVASIVWFVGWGSDDEKQRARKKALQTKAEQVLLASRREIMPDAPPITLQTTEQISESVSNKVGDKPTKKSKTKKPEKKQTFWRDINYVFNSTIAEWQGKPVPPRPVTVGEKPFVYAVTDFVLGPDRVRFDEQAEHRSIAAFLQANGGHLTTGHIIALTGAAYHEAETKFVQVVVRFGGEVALADDGRIHAEFSHFHLAESEEARAVHDFTFYTDAHEDPITLTGNTSERNGLIAALNGFNLVMSVFMYAKFVDASLILSAVLSFFPFAVSSLFYLIPVARLPFVEHAETERLKRQVRRRMLATILWSGKTEFQRDDFIKPTHRIDTRREQEEILAKLLVELEGEVLLDEATGLPTYRFPRLLAEVR